MKKNPKLTFVTKIIRQGNDYKVLVPRKIKKQMLKENVRSMFVSISQKKVLVRNVR